MENNMTGTFEEWLEKAKAGDAVAQRTVGDMYLYGRGVEADYNQATEWYYKAAEQGEDVFLNIELAHLYKVMQEA